MLVLGLDCSLNGHAQVVDSQRISIIILKFSVVYSIIGVTFIVAVPKPQGDSSGI